MIIASAQYNPHDGFINQNIEKHVELVEQAIKSKADLIVFPELSLTGYVRENGKEFSFQANDKRLKVLVELALAYNIVIVVGAPILASEKLYIGSFIIKSDSTIDIYTKQYLHEGEDEYYSSSFDYNPMLKVGNESITFAICADIENPLHSQAAANCGTSIYLASIFYTESGIDGGIKKLKLYAKQHKMAVLMSNYCGDSYGFMSGGKSAFIDGEGNSLTQLSETEEGLLIIEKNGNDWRLLNS